MTNPQADVQDVIDALREGATVLDEPCHRAAIAGVMNQAADVLAVLSSPPSSADGVMSVREELQWLEQQLTVYGHRAFAMSGGIVSIHHLHGIVTRVLDALPVPVPFSEPPQKSEAIQTVIAEMRKSVFWADAGIAFLKIERWADQLEETLRGVQPPPGECVHCGGLPPGEASGAGDLCYCKPGDDASREAAKRMSVRGPSPNNPALQPSPASPTPEQTDREEP